MIRHDDDDRDDEKIGTATAVRTAVARKARPGVRPGDLVARVSAFSYRVGGPRLGYTHHEKVVGYGPGHHPALQGFGWNRPYPHPLPPEAEAREALIARIRAVEQVSIRGDEAALVALRAEGEALAAEVAAFLEAAGPEAAWVLGSPTQGELRVFLRYAEDRLSNMRAVAAAVRENAWRAVAHAPEGDRVTFDGREWVLGPTWHWMMPWRAIGRDGEDVPDELQVLARYLLDPATGNPALYWDETRLVPGEITP